MRYQIRHALIKYAADLIIEDVNFEIHDTEKIAVVGRNGCGKTTLLKLIAGEIKMDNLDSDEECGITMAGSQRIGYLRQISFEDGRITMEDEIKKVFAPIFACESEMQELTEQMQHTIEESTEMKQFLRRYSTLQNQMEALRGYTWRQDMESMVQRFGFFLEDLRKPMGQFSGGQQTKIAFVKLLLSRPDIMLLDEPTNHLDMETIEWLEGYLKQYDRAVVIVSHDRMFLNRVTDVTYEIEYHQMKRYSGNYSAFIRQKEEAAEKQEKDYEAQQKEIARLTAWIEKWKNTPTKVAATRSKRLVIEHMVKVQKPRRFDLKSFHMQFTPRISSYSDVLRLRGLEIGYDHTLCKVDVTVKKQDRMAVVGENGLGKSTLLKTIIGNLPALAGRYEMGTNVEWGYFDQQEAVMEVTDPEQTVINNFWDCYPKLREVEVRNALGSFLFTQEDVYQKMGQLSGGERVRLALCKMMMRRPNFLILDEPTNHMDIVGKETLEKMLKGYEGTVLFVSHDRYFIQQVATCVLNLGQEKVMTVEEFFAGRENKPGTDQQTKSGHPGKVKGKNPVPTLDDVFDKKTYYNPGKIRSRLEQQIKKYNRMLIESEEKLAELTMQQMDPELATDYERLAAITEAMEAEEFQQESLLERLLESETELQEMENQN